MIAVEIPFGYTLIVYKGCIHGDSNFKGMYAMMMTCDHNLMNTADSVFLRSSQDANKTIRVKMVGESNDDIDMSNILSNGIPHTIKIPIVSSIEDTASAVDFGLFFSSGLLAFSLLSEPTE